MKLRYLYLDHREHHLLCHILKSGLKDGALGSPVTRSLLARIQNAPPIDDPRTEPEPPLDLALIDEDGEPR